MCGRFALTLPVDAMAQLFAAAPSNDLSGEANYNICPTNSVPVVVSADGVRRLRPMRWGFVPHWYKTPSDGPLLINARAETLAQKPAFREACRTRRCILPATGFYEWTKSPEGARQPWYIHPADGGPIAFAGVWQDWGDLTTCAIVTTGANTVMQQIHHRMPVTLAPDDYALWLGEAGTGAALLMQSGPEDRFTFFRVSPAVNSNRASGADLVVPL